MTDVLRVTTLDEAFITLSQKAIQFEVRVAGRLDADRLAAAMRRAVARHPLARARLAAAPCRSPCISPLAQVKRR